MYRCFKCLRMSYSHHLHFPGPSLQDNNQEWSLQGSFLCLVAAHTLQRRQSTDTNTYSWMFYILCLVLEAFRFELIIHKINFLTWLKFSEFSPAWVVSTIAASVLPLPFISCSYIWRYLIWQDMKTITKHWPMVCSRMHACIYFIYSTYITGQLGSLLWSLVSGCEMCREAAFTSLLLILFCIGILKKACVC